VNEHVATEAPTSGVCFDLNHVLRKNEILESLEYRIGENHESNQPFFNRLRQSDAPETIHLEIPRR
jgi:hypothetical protein